MANRLYVSLAFGCSASPSKRPVEAKVVALQFEMAQPEMEKVRLSINDDDWTKEGKTIAKPEFKYGQKSLPVVLKKNERVIVEIEIELYPVRLGKDKYTISGKAKWGGLSFSTEVELKGGRQSVKLTSLEPLPNAVTRLEGDIEWIVTANWLASPLPADHSWGHVIYVARGVPYVDFAGPESGLTTKRMEAAIQWVASANSLEPFAIADSLMARFPLYTLKPNPAVPEVLKHPAYLKQDPDQGGAWPMIDHEKSTGECQAIVRLVRGIFAQLGVPGTVRFVVVYAEPREEAAEGFMVLEQFLDRERPTGLARMRKSETGAEQFAALVDAPVEVGTSYPEDHTPLEGGGVSPGLNSFEACLFLEYGATQRYYGGGSTPCSTKEEVITAFWGLVWVENTKDKGFKVMEVVKQWRS